MEKIRVLMVLPNLNAGGAEKVALVLAKNFPSELYDVRLFLVRKVGAFLSRIPANVAVITPRVQYGKFVNSFLSIFSIAREARDADIIIGALELLPTYISYAAGLIARRPVIGWLHVDLSEYLKRVKSVHRLIMRFVYPRLERIVAVSRGVANAVKSEVLANSSINVSVIHNINEELELQGGSYKADIGIVPSARYIIAVGRMVESKGFDILLAAFAEVRKNNKDIELVILGDGPERENLERICRDLDIEDTVHMPGYVDNVGEYMASAWILVHPARHEGLGMVLLEAMERGIPVVATKCPSGPEEILEGGKCGMLVEVGSAMAIANAIKKMSLDKSIYDNFSRIGLERARDFSAVNIIPKWIALIGRTLGRDI